MTLANVPQISAALRRFTSSRRLLLSLSHLSRTRRRRGCGSRRDFLALASALLHRRVEDFGEFCVSCRLPDCLGLFIKVCEGRPSRKCNVGLGTGLLVLGVVGAEFLVEPREDTLGAGRVDVSVGAIGSGVGLTHALKQNIYDSEEQETIQGLEAQSATREASRKGQGRKHSQRFVASLLAAPHLSPSWCRGAPSIGTAPDRQNRLWP